MKSQTVVTASAQMQSLLGYSDSHGSQLLGYSSRQGRFVNPCCIVEMEESFRFVFVHGKFVRQALVFY